MKYGLMTMDYGVTTTTTYRLTEQFTMTVTSVV
jgi:hypothetical protein